MSNNESRPWMFLPCFKLIMFAAALLCALTSARVSSSAEVSAKTKTGIDVLEEQNFAPLRGMRVGLITNQTGVDSKGRRTIDVLAAADGVKLIALFSPEHGISGKLDQDVVDNAKDAATGLPIHSLYGASRRPRDQDLEGLDALVFDIQDAGVRFYTYISTMGYCMEAAAKHHIPFFVLDRPNPLGGERIEGPMLDRDKTAFVAYFPMPIVYGMTLGELAQMFNAENKIGVDLRVVKLKDWKRTETYDDTGLQWIPPSPNLRTVAEALPYPGIEILQAGGVSVGRGTETPFEIVGAPWIRGDALLAELKSRNIPGVEFRSVKFTPASDAHKGDLCEGVRLTISDRATFNSVRNGMEFAEALHKLYPDHFQIAKMIFLVGSQATIDRLERGDPVDQIIAGWSDALASFRAMRAKYLLYD
jgi:uncharacterized protein YbbC (DUF1343 family)